MRNNSRVPDSDDPADLRERGFIPETVVPERNRQLGNMVRRMATREPRVPRIRREAIPATAQVVLVRGDDVSGVDASHAALEFHRRFSDWGRHGLSAYYATSDAELDILAAGVLERFPVLLVYRYALLVEAGIEVVATFRSPHVTLAFSSLDAGLATLRNLDHKRLANEYHGE